MVHVTDPSLGQRFSDALIGRLPGGVSQGNLALSDMPQARLSPSPSLSGPANVQLEIGVLPASVRGMAVKSIGAPFSTRVELRMSHGVMEAGSPFSRKRAIGSSIIPLCIS